MADPEFTVDPFNFEKELWEGYRSFIEKLRSLVAVRYSHNCPVTPIEVNPPARFFDIVLQTNTYSIRVRIRRDNLYLVGYQMQDSDEWLELRYDDNNPVHRITGSTFLNFGDTYANLVGSANVADLGGIQVGRRELIAAINTLATSRNDRERARSMIVVSFMISEATRFNDIKQYFVTQGTTGSPIPAWMQSYVRGWNNLSESLLHVDADNSFRLPANNRFNVFTFEDVADKMGILKGSFFGPPGGQGRLRRAVTATAAAEGRPLVEVFTVKINDINGNKSTIGDIYGTIQVGDGLGYEYGYNRGTNGSESIQIASETPLLNGPGRCITAYDSFTIDVKLMSKEGLSEDDEISKGQISWEITNITTNEYDKMLFQEVKGRFGSATVCYAVLRNAVEATVEVVLIKNGDPANVYGLLTSHNVKLNSESVLFRKANNKFINVKNGEAIPLSRSVVAVPLNSNFIVRADLKGSNIFSADDEIAKGTVNFSPQLSGTDEQNIKGNNSQIRVKVTWAWYV